MITAVKSPLRGLLLLVMMLVGGCDRSESIVSTPPSSSAGKAGQGGSIDPGTESGAGNPGLGGADVGAGVGGGGAPVTGSAGGPGGSGFSSGCWHLTPVDKVRLFPAPGREAQMVGARIVGSNDSATNGFVNLITLDRTPVPGQWIELAVANATAYRWVKYYGPPGSYGAVAELELYAGSER